MHDPWFNLRQFTQARIAQGRAGCALPTRALLDFQLAHAAARDAVHAPWQLAHCQASLTALGMEVLTLATPIQSRAHYLQRPDQGRCLVENSRKLLASRATHSCDIAIIMSNGLSSAAVEQHGVALLRTIITEFAKEPLQLAPLCLVPNARVALADEIGALLHAKLSIIIVGERPGLSAADSLGIYLTYAPPSRQ
jgi:ethanolamine ammonia-lyase small subunit